MNSIIKILFAIVFIFDSIESCAQEDLIEDFEEINSAEIDSARLNRAYNKIYLDGCALLYIPYCVSINIERDISEFFSIRVGYGTSDYFNGAIIMINANSSGTNSYNLGFGFHYFIKEHKDPKDTLFIFPANVIFNFSYRYRPNDGGIFLTTGTNFMFGTLLMSVGIGYIF